MALRQHMPGDIFEKPEWLRRQSVAAPRPAMQGVKSSNRLESVTEFDPQPGPCCLPNATPHCAIETLEERLSSVLEVDRVSVKG
jgi:hypothetical protein